MAHQAHNIPWTLLASQFKLRLSARCDGGATNLHPRFLPAQAGELNHFVTAFVRTLAEHAACEREKFPPPEALSPPPAADAVVIPNAAARKITPTVQRFRQHHAVKWRVGERKVEPQLCAHPPTAGCQCALPLEERQMAAFLRSSTFPGCFGFWRSSGEAFVNSEMVKTLLLYGEMEVLLRVCAHEGTSIKRWWQMFECQCLSPELGWDRVALLALRSYLVINVIHQNPDTWDRASGLAPQTDYRDLKCYQSTLRYCTLTGRGSDVATYPHRQFFGIQDGQFHDSAPLLDRRRWAYLSPSFIFSSNYPYGLMSIDEFLYCEKKVEYLPHATDVQEVKTMLIDKGLPVELALDILEMANYKPLRKLRVASDPFHKENWGDLEAYVNYCWVLMVRCDMLGRAVGLEIPWEEMVVETIVDLWACKDCKHKWVKWGNDENYEWSYSFV